MKKFKAEYITAGIFICTVLFGMFLSVYSFASIHINGVEEDNIASTVNIDWEALYPFETKTEKAAIRQENAIEKAYTYLKSKCEDYSSRKLFGYYNIVEAARFYDNAVDWNIAYVSDYNAVVKLKDGYLTTYTPSRDVVPNARSTVELAEFCRDNGIDFFYANLPAKVCIYEDKDISGVLDFSNQNADRFLSVLDDAGVRNYNFSRILHEDGMNHHEAFYVTDLHWKTETGLWAARHIVSFLRDNYGWDIDPDILDPERFNYVVYPKWFLGSEGKKVTLERTEPDDFTMIYPKFETKIRYEVPDIEINVSGDFAVMYDMSKVEVKDYTNKSPYHAYSYGDRPLIRSENYLVKNGKRILLIHDSYLDCVLPFIVITNQYVDAVDLRYFSGGIKSFILSDKPDIVILMYNDTILGRTDPANLMIETAETMETDKKFFDFR